MNYNPELLNPGIHVVALGGGTGLANLLRGLKHRLRSRVNRASIAEIPDSPMISNITAIVAMTDDGGSSGRLREAFRMPPPGDLRNCMVALSEDGNLFSHLFQHRFSPGSELGDHSFGNLCIAALSQMTGDYLQAVELACELLAVKGHVLPVTATDTTLLARMRDGSYVVGETALTRSPLQIAEVTLNPPNAPALPAALDAIAAADLITVGPGSLYTSLITNLLVKGISEALSQTRATRVYVSNLMTQPYESLGLTLSQQIKRIYEHARNPIFDYALVNTGPVPASVLKNYIAQGVGPVVADLNSVKAMGIRCFTGDFVAKVGTLVHHNPELLANALMQLPILLPQHRLHPQVTGYQSPIQEAPSP